MDLQLTTRYPRALQAKSPTACGVCIYQPCLASKCMVLRRAGVRECMRAHRLPAMPQLLPP